MPDFTDAELAAFIDEALAPDRSSELETALRSDDSLRQRLVQTQGRDTAGLHSIGAVWRRLRLSCPDRDVLGQFILGVLSSDQADYIRFHLDTIGCRYCAANLDDLKTAASESETSAEPRRKKYFQTSVGHLPKQEK